MIRPILIATLALTLPCAAFAQSDKPEKPDKSDKPALSEDHPAPPTPHHDRVAYPLGTDCGKLPSRVEMADCSYELAQTRLIRLTNVSAQNDANEILVAVRNIADPSIKVYLVSSIQTIVLSTYPQELDRIEALVHQLDQPHRTYRLTYTVTESDGGQRIGVAHYSFVIKTGQETSLKQGSKVPVATGSYNASGNTSQEQFTYLDVGMNFDATLEQNGDNVSLKTKVEQSGVAEEKDIASVREPVIRQAVIQCVTTLIPGKPVDLGAMDVTGSTRHLEVEVLAEPL
jgi:hypothetical protein